MKVLITNIVTLNVGDAAILSGMQAILRREFGDDLEIVVFDKNAEAAARYYPWAEFRQSLFLAAPSSLLLRALGPERVHLIRRWDRFRYGLAARMGARGLAGLLASRSERENLAEYTEADAVISSGGTYLVENYGMLSRIHDYEVTLASGTPLAFFTQSMGPFRDPTTTPRLKRIFHAAKAICLRDAASREHLRELDVPDERTGVFADAAFALYRDPGPASGEDGRRPEGLRVAISVREWKHFKTVDPSVGEAAYFDAVARLAEHLISRYGAEVVFASTCQGMPEYWTDDSLTAEEIVGRMDPALGSAVVVDREARGPDELIDFYSSCDLVVATRMHSAILALCGGTPVLPVAYEFKTKELFKRLTLERWVVDIERADGDLLCALADDFVANLTEVRAVIGREVPRERAAALAAGRFIAERIFSVDANL